MSLRKFLSPLVMCFLISVMFMSCSKTENGNVEYIPFQETDDGQWGMISMDGKVLFQEEFKNKPTVVRDGRFFVRSKEGIWEMYDATEKPKKIGADYVHTSGFHNGRALVAVKNQAVSIIDTDGKEINMLDKINGKEVDGVRAFCEGYAVFMTVDSLWGVIDNDGKCVVKPEYCSLNNCGDGKFIGVNNKYKKDVDKGKKDKVKISIINTSGEVLFDFAADKYENMQNQFVDGKLAISVKKDGKEIWGIIDDKGKTIVKPSAKLKNIGTIYGNLFTYNNGEGWGLMNIKGETLIRAKYEYLYIDDENLFIATVKNDDSYEYKYIDKNDDQVGDDTYVSATLFTMFDGAHALVKPNDNIYSIIDKEGKLLEGLPDIVNIGTYEGESYIESDYVDLNKLVAGFNLTQDGMLGLTFLSKPQDVAKLQVETGYATGNNEHKAGTPYWYDNTEDIYLFKKVNGIEGFIDIEFTGKLSRQTYYVKKVIDYTYGDWYWYHNKKVPTGYVWNNVKPTFFFISIRNNGRMSGKLRALYKVLYAKFKRMGKIEKENNSAAVIGLKNGMRALICMEKNFVSVCWGNLKSTQEIDISKYKDASEEDNKNSLSYGYLNDLFPDTAGSIGTDFDLVASDSDSIVALDY